MCLESCAHIPPSQNSLDIYANNVATPDNQEVTNTQKVLIRRMRTVAGGLTWKRVKCCGNWLPTTGEVAVNRNENGSFFSGLESCSSVWACPCCGIKIMGKRAKEVRSALDTSRELGWTSGMLTLTIPHHHGQSFRELQRLVSGSFRKLQNRRKFKNLKAEYKLQGMIRSLEITHGKNGWHPHLHILLFTEATEEENQELALELFQIWKGIIEKSGYGICSIDAYDFDSVRNDDEAAQYVAKWDIAREISGNAMSKTAKTGSRNPFQILADITESRGNVKRDKALFSEYAKGSKGQRQLTWSKGLKSFLCVEEKTDQELVDEKEDGEQVAAITGSIYCEARKQKIDPYLLIWIDVFGVEYAAEKLAEHGIHAVVIGGDLRTGSEGIAFKKPLTVGKAQFEQLTEKERVCELVEKSNPVGKMRERLAKMESKRFNPVTGQIEQYGTAYEIKRFTELVEETKEEVRLKIASVSA